MNRKIIHSILFIASILIAGSCAKKGDTNKNTPPPVIEGAEGDGFRNPFVTDIYTACHRPTFGPMAGCIYTHPMM